MKKVIKKQHRKKPGLIGRTYHGSLQVVAKHWVTGLVALFMSSIVPILQQWHSDKQTTDSINAVASDASSDNKCSEARCTQLVKDLDDRTDRHIIEVENNENAKVKAIWDYLGQQKDKNKK